MVLSGKYREPITVEGRRGTAKAPFVIRGDKAWIGSNVTFDTYRKPANRLAAAHQEGGSFPGVYFLADNAALVVRNCQWLVIEDLVFENCWPTSIYLDNCQHVTIRRVSIRGGTIAIGAAGAYTRHILIEDCDWVQDVSGSGEEDVVSIRAKKGVRPHGSFTPGELWRKYPWSAVHGAPAEGPDSVEGLVNIDDDARAFDGDFFRAWTIAGYVIIRNNVIVDAFNGVHFFNQAGESIKDNFSRNVLIEDNWFVRIRDNAVEPENFAWNWTVRGNTFVDCYMPFSFEMDRSGYFYVYGNVGWNIDIPGPDGDTHAKGQLFKFPDTHSADGPHYVFNNTWLLRWPIVKKKLFSNLVHTNNLIGYATDSAKYKVEGASPFGNGWNIDDFPTAQVHSPDDIFTRNWPWRQITVNGDVIDHPHFPDIVRAANYCVGPAAQRQPVVFGQTRPVIPESLRIASPPSAIAMDINLANRKCLQVRPDGYVVGAWQGEDRLAIAGPAFSECWPGDEDRGPKTS
jgi:hypothetical protein